MKAARDALRFSSPDGRSGRLSVRCARGFADRLIGLIGSSGPGAPDGLWLEPCMAVHTFGVRGALDLVFVSSCMVVLRIDAQVAPRSVRAARGARAVLELGGGEARRLGLRVGARLAWCAAASVRCAETLRPIRVRGCGPDTEPTVPTANEVTHER